MHSQQIAWAAGLFEGEGYISPGRKGGKSDHSLAMNMCDRDVLEHFCDVVGWGSVKERHSKELDAAVASGRCKPSFTWGINNKAQTRRILDSFLPFLGSRRAHRALDLLDKIELNK